MKTVNSTKAGSTAGKSHNSGFTIIELMIGMALSILVLAIVYQAYENQVRATNTNSATSAMQQNSRAVMYYLMRELRSAGHDPLDSADAGITAANASSITFSFDVTGGEADGRDNDRDGTVDNNETYDGAINVATEQVTYALNGNVFTRNGLNVAENINSLTFTYFDENGNTLVAPVADPDDIRVVRITLVAGMQQVVMGREGGNARTLRLVNDVNIRNLGFL